ncbi:MAG: redoxin domain-containing protein, partial [Clostridia bacterium]|nr:redoxin domain-containing protein [Clostridia bacterium]
MLVFGFFCIQTHCAFVPASKEIQAHSNEQNPQDLIWRLDTKGSAANAYGVMSIPTTYFIDKDGNVVTHAVGTI